MFLSHFQTAISSPTMCPFSDWFSHLSHAVPWTNPAKLHHISIEELNPGAQHRACERPGFPHHPIPILNSPWLYGSIWVRHMCGIPCSNQGFLRFEPQIWYQLVAVAGGKKQKTSSFLKTPMVSWPAAMDQLQVAQNHSTSILRTHSHHFHIPSGNLT